MMTLGAPTATGLKNSLDDAQTRLLSNIQKLSTGLRNNSAADDPVAIAQSTSYQVQISGLAQSINGMADSAALLTTASGALGQIDSGLQQINQLAVQAGNGALSSSDLQAIQTQANQIVQGIDQVAGNASFAGINLLDGSFNRSVQTGGEGATQGVTIPDSSARGLGLAGLDLTSSAGRADAFDAIGKALQQVDATQTRLSAVQSGIAAGLANAAVASENLAAANSRLNDTDYAAASSDRTQAQVRQQAALKALTLYNNNQKSALDLLP